MQFAPLPFRQNERPAKVSILVHGFVKNALSQQSVIAGPKKGAKPPTTVQAVIPVTDEISRNITQFDDPRSRQPQQPQQYSPAGYRPGAPRPAPQAPAARPSPQRPHYDQHDAHFACQNDSQQSFDSHCTRASSGYHSSSGYQSDEGSFESKMLSRATKERPANVRMTAARDYAPCCDEELPVKRGQRVQVLYKMQDWVFAVTKSGDSGYLPYSCVRPSRKYGGYQSEPEYTHDIDYASGYDTDIPQDRSRGHGRTHQIGDVSPLSHVPQGFRRVGSGSPRSARKPSADGYLSAVEEYPSSSSSYIQQPRPAKSLHSIIDSSSPKSYRPVECKPDLDSFVREFIEELVVIHSFEAKEEDEIVVSKGEKVQVLNADDPSWLWVRTVQGDEGFIPRSCCALGNHPRKSFFNSFARCVRNVSNVR